MKKQSPNRELRVLFCLYCLFPVWGETLAAQETITLDLTVNFDHILMENRFADRDQLEAYAVEMIKEEARFIFSGMIYGFRFELVPENPSRGVDESFLLEPVRSLAADDESMRVYQSVAEGNALSQFIRYDLQSDQERFRENMLSSRELDSQGYGFGYETGFDARRAAIDEAIKQSVINHLMQRSEEIPQRITGYVTLTSPPILGYGSGRYRAAVRCRTKQLAITSYDFF